MAIAAGEARARLFPLSRQVNDDLRPTGWGDLPCVRAGHPWHS
jgi:hypothetical protein